MNELNQREVKTEKAGVAPDGTVVQEKTHSYDTQVGPKTVVVNIIWYLYGLIAILLAIRFILRLTGANGNAGFVSFTYTITGVLSAPFDAIFGVTKASNGTFTSVFEPSILVAIAVYGLIAWGVVQLLNINKPHDTDTI